MVHVNPIARENQNRCMSEKSVRKEWTFSGRIWALIGVVNHILTVAITIYTSYLALQGNVGFYELHIVLPTIGYQLLMAQAILSFSGENVWSYFMDRNLRKSVHFALGAMGSTLAVAGTSLMISTRSTHFVTMHGILGFVAMLFVLTTFINGPVAYFVAKIKFVRPVYIKINHYFIGTAGFVIGMSSLIHGFQKNWFISRTSQEISTTIVILCSITIILTMRSALVNMFYVTKSIIQK